jgi:hypothetical protein
LRVADLSTGTPADELVIDGEVFEVHSVERWRALLKHYKAIAVGRQEGP